MKSLIVSQETQSRIGLAPCGPGGLDETVAASIFIPGMPMLVVATSANNLYCWSTPRAAGPTSNVSGKPPVFSELSWDLSLGMDGLQPLIAAESTVKAIDYCVEEDSITIACSRGELLSVYGVSAPYANGAAPDVEVVGTFDSGILSAQWSPDGEYLALVTGLGLGVFLTRTWEIVAEHEVAPGSSVSGAVSWRGDGKFVSLSVALPSGEVRARVFDRASFAPAHTVEPLVLGAPGSDVVASWQPNGRHLYIAARAPEESLSSLRTRTAQGLASARATGGEAGAPADDVTQQGLQGGSSGGSDAPRITLVETNGLLHGEVDLRCGTSGRVEALSWSPCSEALAASVRLQDGRRALQVWTRSNWHWYLKFERTVGAGEGALFLSWDPERSLTLQAVSSAGLVTTLEFFRDVLQSTSGTVAVVDRQCIRVTALGAAVVPPPLCHVRLTVPDEPEAGFVAVCIRDYDEATGSAEGVAAVTSSGRLVLAECPEEDLWEEVRGPGGAGQYDASPSLALQEVRLAAPLHPQEGRSVRQLAWSGPETLLVLLGPSESSGDDLLVELQVAGWEEKARRAIAAQEPIVRLVGGADAALISDARGKVYEFSSSDKALRELYQLPSPARLLRSVLTSSTKDNSALASFPLAALDDAGRLYLGPTLVASDATSVAIRHGGAGGSFLCFTNRENQLRCVPLSTLTERKASVNSDTPLFAPASKQAAVAGVPWTEVHANIQEAMRVAMRPDGADGGAQGPKGAPAARDTSLRSVELGSQLVVAPPEGVQVVLQMPRGNLEGVSPRSLVLAGVVEALRQGDWAAAWELATVHRLDLNLLVDFGWPRFLSQADEFVKSIASVSDLGDFVFNLNTESTLSAEEGLYSSHPYIHRDSDEHRRAGGDLDEAPSTSNKVTDTCGALRAAMLRRDAARFTLPVLNTYLRSQPPLLGEALLAVKALKEAEVSGRSAPGAPTAEAAIRHLLIHVDVDRLYRAALQLYDLPVAYMVIASSQRDPAEYLQELKAFAQVEPEAYRRYTIDLSLGHYPSALRHLFEFIEAGHPKADFDELIELATARGLLREALELYAVPGKEDKRRRILEAYGANLEGRVMFEDAALAYSAAGNFAGALRCYVGAGAWQMAFYAAGKLGYDAAATAKLARDLVTQLLSMGYTEAAGHVSLQYLSDADNGVAYLSQAGEWREALRSATRHGRPDLIPTVIEPSVAEQSASLLEDLVGNRERIDKCVTRWREVRRRRTDLAAALATAEVDPGEFSRAVDPVDREDAQSEAFSNVTGLSMYTTGTGTVGGSSVASTSQAPSTLGGRGKARAAKKAAKKRNRIQAGSVNEELQLVEHIRSLAPQERHLTAAGKLCEVLVQLGHESDARTIQMQLGKYVDEYQAADAALRAEAEVEAKRLAAMPNAPPLSAALQLAAAPGPQIPSVSWKWDILRAPGNAAATGSTGIVGAAT